MAESCSASIRARSSRQTPGADWRSASAPGHASWRNTRACSTLVWPASADLDRAHGVGPVPDDAETEAGGLVGEREVGVARDPVVDLDLVDPARGPVADEGAGLLGRLGPEERRGVGEPLAHRRPVGHEARRRDDPRADALAPLGLGGPAALVLGARDERVALGRAAQHVAHVRHAVAHVERELQEGRDGVDVGVHVPQRGHQITASGVDALGAQRGVGPSRRAPRPRSVRPRRAPCGPGRARPARRRRP